ncbi:MAG: recombinase family protein [Acidobacteriota bacterium]
MTTKRCIELIRVSTEGQAASNRASIPSQRTVNRRTALAYGLTIVRSIEMSDVSGAAVLLAPEIRELIMLMQDREIHGVVAREFSRLMRPENFGDYALLQAFADSQTILYLPEGPLDFASKTGRLMGTIRAAIAGMERTEILERVWNAKEEKRRSGGFGQSPICLPFGVTFNGQWAYTDDAIRVTEAFRLFLSGETNYATIGRKIGLPHYSIKIILSNPIYTGWRVIDQKRDLTAAGKYATKDGRQGDRRKVKRAPEEVIRVKVLEPLVSESEFQQAQRIIEAKRKLSWRSKEGLVHRFTYNGFLLCGDCRSLLYTKYMRRDYYVCKQRCGAPYQGRETLEKGLDRLFAKRLAVPSFLKRYIYAPMARKNQPRADVGRLQAQLKTLAAKKQRIVDYYFEGGISATERDLRVAEVKREQDLLSEMIGREAAPAVSLDSLLTAFSPFQEFDLMGREDKRKLLNILTPSVEVARYAVKGLWVSLDEAPTDMGSLRPPT